ncbi:MAG TPA: S8 family serine peptidase [Thermoanaerobaculia bacterium]
MKRTLYLLLALTVTLSALAAEKQRYIIGTKAPSRIATQSMRDGWAERFAQRRVRTFDSIRALAVELTPEEVAELRKSDEVRYIAPVTPIYLNELTPSTKSSPYDSTQSVPWGIDAIHARDVWKVSKGSDAVHVAVIDTGIDIGHADLHHAVMGGYDAFKNENGFPVDDHRHGTHVAGTIAAADNGLGVVGVAPNVKLWSVKVLDSHGDGSNEGLVAGVDWVIKKKAEIGGRWIMNLSLGAKGSDTAQDEIFARAIADGILVFAASGNQGLPGMDFPAAHPGVFAIGALEENGEKAWFSNFGPGLTFMAPGVNVVSSVPRGWAVVGDALLPTGERLRGVAPKGSPKGELSGEFVFCGLGRIQDIPVAGLNGKIAVVIRGNDGSGTMYFREKVRNVKNAGAKGVVIVNDDDVNKNDLDIWQLDLRTCDPTGCYTEPEWEGYVYPLTIGITAAQGEKLRAQIDKGSIEISHRNEDYAPLSGTSMSTPHAAGTAALAWSVAPNATADQMRTALIVTARDQEEAGWDWNTGYGTIDALAVAKYLNPAAFGGSTTPRRRGARH